MFEVNNRKPSEQSSIESRYHRLSDSSTINPDFYELPSGNRIRITNISPFDFPQSGHALVMHYETNIAITDKQTLRKEVDEIWEVFRKDAEAANVKAVAIRAVHNGSNGFVKSGNGYGFVFLKQDEGTWYCLDDEKR